MSVSKTAFHFAPISHGPVTAQWSSKMNNFPFPQRSHMRSAAEDEDEAERQLDYETDANTEYNAALLSANIRPQRLPEVDVRDKGKGKSRDKARDKEKERTRRQKDQARRMRRRADGLGSDTTQGDDTDDDEYVTGHGSSHRHASAAPAHGHSHPQHASTSMPNIPPAPTSAHPYVSNIYTSPANQYGYPGAQPQYGYGYAGATPSSAGAGGYFSPSAPASANFPNLFASTDPHRKGREAAEAAARQKLERNPLPGLPGSGMGTSKSVLDNRGFPPYGAAAGKDRGAGRNPYAVGAAEGRDRGAGRSLDIPDRGGFGTLPGGYGPAPSREKSKSKHGKSSSTGTLPAHSQPGYGRTPQPVDPPASKSKGRGRGEEKDKNRSRSRQRPERPGWDTAESLLGQPMNVQPGIPDALRGAPDPHFRSSGDPLRDMHAMRGPSDPHGRGAPDPHGLRGVRDGPSILHGVPVVNAGPPLEREHSRSKWGKITGLFGRGRRGSSASQNQPEPNVYVPPPAAATTRHKTGLRNLSFDRLRRPSKAANATALPPRMSADAAIPSRTERPDVGLPPGHVPVGVHVDKYGKIVDPPDDFLGGAMKRERVQGFRPGRDEVVEGPLRMDPSGMPIRMEPGRRTSSDVGYARDHMGMGMRRTSSDAPLPGGYGVGMGPPPLGGPRRSFEGGRRSFEGGRRPSVDSRPSLDGPDAYGPAPTSRHRSGSGSMQPPPPLTGTIGTNPFPGYERSPAGIPPPLGGGMPGLAGGIPPLGGPPPLGAPGGIPPLAGGGVPGSGIPPPMKSPAGLHRQSSWDAHARSPGMAASLVSPHTPRGAPSPHMQMPSPHVPKGTPRYVSDSILSPRPSEAFTGRVEGAGATPYMRERAPSIATTVPRTLPRPRTADSTVFGTVMDPHSPMETPSPDVAEVDMARAAQHREAFEWAEQEAIERVDQGDNDAPYIFNGFPTWVNWDLFTRLENLERQQKGEPLLPRVRSSTRPEKLQDIYDEWHRTRDKWVDRFWDPAWARFMHETGGPIQRELAEERQTPNGRALEAARVYQRENSELPLAKREFARGYLWDEGYTHKDWQWIKLKPWRWTVEHENDERRATGRAPLPRHNPGMSADDWRDVRDVWHTTASKWAEKRKDLEWVERDRREGITPQKRYHLEQQFLRSRPAQDERDKIRHDSAMEALARRREQAGMTPKVSEAELARRRLAQEELDALMRTPATTHPRPVSSVGHGSMRRGEGSVRLGGSSIGHANASRENFGRPIDDDTSPYDSTTSEDVPPANPYLRAPGGLPPPPQESLPEWMRRPKTSDPPSSSLHSGPGRNPSVPSVNITKKSGILKGILKRTLSRNNQNGAGRNNSQRRNEQPTHHSFGGMFGHSRSEVSPIDNPWAGVHRSTHPVEVQPIRFDRSHPFSMTSPHAIEYDGKLYPSAIHLWHAMRFLRRPVGRGRGRTEESWHPELAEGIRQATEPELYADQWAHAGAIGKDGSIMRSLQRPDWDEIQMDKMDEVLALKFTQHPSLGKRLVSTHPAQLLYMWDAPWGAGTDLKGSNNLGKAIMRCRERLMQYQGR
ncbi:Serine/arginine repetitive matrix protein [Ceratobasidium sp. AG-Ba]|nr:Serine/arginine repetitive matrix protein [Ceratobasidium sp. AG-Ba]